MYRKYYSYNDMPKPVTHTNTKALPSVCENRQAVTTYEKNEKKGLLASLESDDIILIAVLIILFMNDCDDKLLLAAIAFLLFSNG